MIALDCAGQGMTGIAELKKARLVLLALWRSWNIADSEVNVKLTPIAQFMSTGNWNHGSTASRASDSCF